MGTDTDYVPVFAPPGMRRLCVMRDGHAVVRDWQIPKPTVLVDTREQQPFDLAGRHPSWLSKHFTYWWLEQNGHERTLIDTDCL